MNLPLRLTIVAGCALLCAAGIFGASRVRQHDRSNDVGISAADDSLSEYRYATSDAPLKLNQIEAIVRRDPLTRSHHGRMEFGSVNVEQGTVMVEVMFLEDKTESQAFLCRLMCQSDVWRVTSAQRLWFVPRTHFLRGLRA